MPINVLIVDDEELLLQSLKLTLDGDSEINVIGMCKNGDEAYKTILQGLKVNVILMDIRMPVCNGITATKKILDLRRYVNILVLTTFDDDEYIFEALKLGAKGYLLKTSSPVNIIDAVKIVSRGNLLVHPDIASKLPSLLVREKKVSFDTFGFSDIELKLMKFISKGLSNREIANALFIEEGTVKNKITEILNKLDLRNRTQLAIYYLNNNYN